MTREVKKLNKQGYLTLYQTCNDPKQRAAVCGPRRSTTDSTDWWGRFRHIGGARAAKDTRVVAGALRGAEGNRCDCFLVLCCCLIKVVDRHANVYWREGHVRALPAALSSARRAGRAWLARCAGAWRRFDCFSQAGEWHFRARLTPPGAAAGTAGGA